MNKHRKAFLLIPVEYALFWEVLFFFWWWVLIGMEWTTEMQTNGLVEWDFLIFITLCLATLTTPGLTIIESAVLKWLDYRAEQIAIGKREINRIFKWLSKRVDTDKRIDRYMKKHNHGDRWY